MKEAHLIVAYQYEHGQRPRRGIPKKPVAACGNAKPGDEFVSLYEVRNDPSALAAEEATVTCDQCVEWLADEDHRLELLDVTAWIRKHASLGDRDLRYIDIPVDE